MERDKTPLISQCKEEFESLMSQISLVLDSEQYEDFCEWAKMESGWM